MAWLVSAMLASRAATGTASACGMRPSAKQAVAKRGSRNLEARQVEVVTPDLNKRLFDTATEAASFLGVTQQLVDQWLSGKVALPGQGRTCRKTHLIGLQIRYT